jgi:hypothetical protein
MSHAPSDLLMSPLEEIGLNIPSVWEDFYGADIRSWNQIVNEEGALGLTARASLRWTATKFHMWPLELAFHIQDGQPSCRSVTIRNIAILYPMGGPEIWSGNKIFTSLTFKPPILMDGDGCLANNNHFRGELTSYKKLPLWEYPIHD